MIKKTLNTLFLIAIITFFFLTARHYFSNENVILTNKSRSSYQLMKNQDNENLPLLKSDTNNIIIYKDGLEEFKKKRKKRIWEELISSKNE